MINTPYLSEKTKLSDLKTSLNIDDLEIFLDFLNNNETEKEKVKNFLFNSFTKVRRFISEHEFEIDSFVWTIDLFSTCDNVYVLDSMIEDDNAQSDRYLETSVIGADCVFPEWFIKAVNVNILYIKVYDWMYVFDSLDNVILNESKEELYSRLKKWILDSKEVGKIVNSTSNL